MKALVVIDIQNMLIRMKPYESTRFLQRVGILIEQARKRVLKSFMFVIKATVWFRERKIGRFMKL